MRNLKMLFFITALVALGAGSANAEPRPYLNVKNTSDTCAWVTVDVATKISPWKNENFHYVEAGGSWNFGFTAAPEVKVRAEPTRNANCSGGKIGDMSIEKKNFWDTPTDLDAVFKGEKGRYTLVFVR
jgi:hypothetical protein